MWNVNGVELTFWSILSFLSLVVELRSKYPLNWFNSRSVQDFFVKDGLVQEQNFAIHTIEFQNVDFFNLSEENHSSKNFLFSSDSFDVLSFRVFVLSTFCLGDNRIPSLR